MFSCYRTELENQIAHPFFSELPKLHTWDGGKTWNAGGFEPSHLVELHTFLRERLPANPAILETGAGNTTICFLLSDPARLISVEPSAKLFERIKSYCDRHRLSRSALEPVISASEWALPRLAMSDPKPEFDFVLIDGCHSAPNAFVDLLYGNEMLKQGGFLMVDDIHLHSVREVALYLRGQKGFELVQPICGGKSIIFRRSDNRTSGYEWHDNAYTKLKTEQIERSSYRFALPPLGDL